MLFDTPIPTFPLDGGRGSPVPWCGTVNGRANTQALCGGGGRVCAESQKATASACELLQKRLDGEGEARLIAMACGEPPEGRASWTLKLLADQLVECEIVGTISTETRFARRLTKKRTEA